MTAKKQPANRPHDAAVVELRDKGQERPLFGPRQDPEARATAIKHGFADGIDAVYGQIDDLTRHRVIRRLIGIEVDDLLQATHARIESAGVASVEPSGVHTAPFQK